MKIGQRERAGWQGRDGDRRAATVTVPYLGMDGRQPVVTEPHSNISGDFSGGYDSDVDAGERGGCNPHVWEFSDGW